MSLVGYASRLSVLLGVSADRIGQTFYNESYLLELLHDCMHVVRIP